MVDSIGTTDAKPRGSFLRAVGMLAGAAALAHGITALSMPVLSRLYSPADFSTLAAFSSMLAIIGVAAGLRFDVAVPIPDNDDDSVNLLGLALLCAAAIAIILAIPVALMPEKIGVWVSQPRLVPMMWMLPVGTFLVVGYSALQGWFVRRNAFSLIARSRIAQSATSSGTQLGAGMLGWSPFGLLFGNMLNSGAACITLGIRWFRQERTVLSLLSISGMRRVAREYHRFPKYSTFEAVCNSAAIQLPIIIIAAVAVGPEAGYLSMAMYAMQAPMSLIGTAVGQVYLSRAPDEFRQGRLSDFTAEIIGGLLKAGVGPLLFAGIVSPIAFAFVFGEEWRRAGNLVSWMTPWFIMQFIAVPISMSLHVTGRQRAALILQLFGLFVRVSSVWCVWKINVHWISETYAVAGFVVYFTYTLVIIGALSIRYRQLQPYLVRSLKYIVPWIVGSLLLHAIYALARAFV